VLQRSATKKMKNAGCAAAQRSKKQKKEESLLRAAKKKIEEKGSLHCKKKEKKKAYLYNAWIPLRLQAQFQAPSSCSNSKLAPAQRFWSSGDGVRGGGVGRW
jgi:hypothetical protein